MFLRSIQVLRLENTKKPMGSLSFCNTIENHHSDSFKNWYRIVFVIFIFVFCLYDVYEGFAKPNLTIDKKCIYQRKAWHKMMT